MLVASGDQRLAANQTCWPTQAAMEEALRRAFAERGWTLERGHPIDHEKEHGFIDSQRMGLDVFAKIDPELPIVVAESVWQYSHHVLPGLIRHRGPILTVANWSGQWPGLVGLLNLNGGLTKAGRAYSTLWSETFQGDFFAECLDRWLADGHIEHDTSHANPFHFDRRHRESIGLGERIAKEIQSEGVLMGVFDEGCMGMFNAIIPDELLMPMNVHKERLSQSALLAAMEQVSEDDVEACYGWLISRGMTFEYGDDSALELTKEQVCQQIRMYISAARMGDQFGCEAIGIQYQLGLIGSCPASDLAEGMLNNSDRPPVRNPAGEVIKEGQPYTHFNEVDECAGLDGILTQRVWTALGQPPENTLHDLRWEDKFEGEYIWVFEISGAAPPAHHVDGWKGSRGYRQPPMYFPQGGSTLAGVAKPGPIVWSRIYIEDGRLKMDCGLGEARQLPEHETRRRLEATTKEWPIMHAKLNGVIRDQMMARHKSNHIQVAYATSPQKAEECLYAKAACARELGIEVWRCGD